MMKDFPSFDLRFGGAFWCKDGPSRQRGRACCNKKLCFVARRRNLLARHLACLSEREDCFFVKFASRARDGMYQGRCFLQSEQAVGEVWASYKRHPALFCTIQDDEFTEGFRELSRQSGDLWQDEDCSAESE